MAENEKTAPNSSVGADERQSSQSLNTNIIAQPPPKIKWLGGGKKIKEPFFCGYICDKRAVVLRILLSEPRAAVHGRNILLG
ncbi:unknown [Eubacterium sp. CAG:786]|nr:unknown [Eubacterium sp. CAG:786]